MMPGFEEGVVGQIAPNLLDRLLRELVLVGDVGHNVEDAAEALSQLRASRNDLRDAIDRSPQQVRPEQVENWFRSVEEVDRKMAEVQRDYDNRCLLCAGSSCSPNIFSSYAISRRAVQKLHRAKALLREYHSVRNLTGESPPASCIPKPTVSDGGRQRHLLDQVLGYLDEEQEEAGIVSICGMAGVGKSELMRRVNNEFLPGAGKAEVFKLVIWVDNASSDVSAVQDKIAERLKLGDLGAKADGGDAEDRAAPIFSALKNTSFLVLLDNLMGSVSLAAIGIPNPVHRRPSRAWKQKVVLTTRFKCVCGPMDSCRRIDVPCLDWDASWKLFTESVGQAARTMEDSREIGRLARHVARECGGLPVALQKIGRAMSTKVQPDEWRRTAEFLSSSRIHQIPGMETENTEMLRDLKRSYDHGVFSPGHRECFLCCALWPRGASIGKAELIDCWIGLGLISEPSHDLAVLSGFSIISSLQDANLLLPGGDGDGETNEVKLQEVVRDMALWVARDCGRDESKWVVQAGVSLSAKYEVTDLCESAAAAERVSLMHNSIQELPQSNLTASCPRLALLMLQHNDTLTSISGAFLRSASAALAYLDLSHTAVEELPEELGTLAMLQYLNLSFTPLKALPVGLANLGRLKHLFLKHTSLLSTIPVGVFRGMPSLRVIDMYPSRYMDWEPEEAGMVDSFAFAFEQTTAFIQSLGITVNSIGTVQRLGRLINICTRRLLMTRFDSPPSVTLCPSRFKGLMNSFSLLETLLELSVTKCDTLEQLVLEGEERQDGPRNQGWCLPKLEHLDLCGLTKLEGITWKNVSASFFLPALLCLKIENCSRLRNVSWIMHLHCLQHLELRDCAAMESVVDGQEQPPSFPSLMTMVLVNLPVLSRVCSEPVSCTCLEAIKVGRCDNLKRMHVKPQRRLQIQGSMDWWQGLEWDGDSHVALHHYFLEGQVV